MKFDLNEIKSTILLYINFFIVQIYEKMSSYYQKNKEKLSNRVKNITKITKKDWEKKQEINVENYLTKKKT